MYTVQYSTVTTVEVLTSCVKYCVVIIHVHVHVYLLLHVHVHVYASE